MKQKKTKTPAEPPPTDLVVLVADRNTSAAITGILERPRVHSQNGVS